MRADTYNEEWLTTSNILQCRPRPVGGGVLGLDPVRIEPVFDPVSRQLEPVGVEIVAVLIAQQLTNGRLRLLDLFIFQRHRGLITHVELTPWCTSVTAPVERVSSWPCAGVICPSPLPKRSCASTSSCGSGGSEESWMVGREISFANEQ